MQEVSLAHSTANGDALQCLWALALNVGAKMARAFASRAPLIDSPDA